jgi:Domain of unknown function (DUF1905)
MLAAGGKNRRQEPEAAMAGVVTFRGRIRTWRSDPPGGLAVIDVPADLVPTLGGRRQRRVRGTLDGTAFAGSSMLVAGGGLCVGVSRAALKAAGRSVGDEVEVTLESAASGR